MIIKSVNGRWHGTLSPLSRYPSLIASSTFNATNNDTIEIHSFDTREETLDMKSVCRSKVADQVTALAWSPYGAETEDKKLGILITGLSSGKLAFWNPAEMLKAKDLSEDRLTNFGCLGMHQIEEPIRCLAVNSYKPNLVVSGGSTVLIHNFDKGFKNIESFSPAQITTEMSITISVGWNYRVPHIFASASENGTVTVWDLKNKKAIMSLSDQNFNLDVFNTESLHQNRAKHMSLMWHPDNPTQLAVACDDDRFPYINIWDLRKAATPVSVLSGYHSAGILDLSWCTQDSNFLLASSKDGKTICWNIKAGEPMGESVSHPVSKVQWSNELKAIFTTTTTDGVVRVYSHHDAINPNLFKGKKAPELTAPQWLQRRVGSSFGFGGKLLTFNTHDKVNSVISLGTLPADPEFHQTAREFDALVSEGTFDKLCATKVEENPELHAVNMEWRFLQALAENKKEVLLNALGYDPPSLFICF